MTLKRQLKKWFPELGTQREMEGGDTVESLCSAYHLPSSAKTVLVDRKLAKRLVAASDAVFEYAETHSDLSTHLRELCNRLCDATSAIDKDL